MNRSSWKALLLYLLIGYVFSMAAGIILCNIWRCSQALVSGTILQPVSILTVLAWMILRGKEKKEKE